MSCCVLVDSIVCLNDGEDDPLRGNGGKLLLFHRTDDVDGFDGRNAITPPRLMLQRAMMMHDVSTIGRLIV